jgi:hypothetical protein
MEATYDISVAAPHSKSSLFLKITGIYASGSNLQFRIP